jgi:protein-S-isoprenylcysteine O-methyltransferase Ste14
LSRVIFPKPYADAVAKLRVTCGFVLVAAFLWLSAPTLTSLAAGIPVSILGLALRAWAAGHLQKDSTLTDSGPYAWVRNPLYLGTLSTAAGFVIASRRWELWGPVRSRLRADLFAGGGSRRTASRAIIPRLFDICTARS